MTQNKALASGIQKRLLCIQKENHTQTNEKLVAQNRFSSQETIKEKKT